MPLALGTFWEAYIIATCLALINFNLKFFKERKLFLILSICFLLLKLLQGANFHTFLFFKTFLGLYFFIIYFQYFNKVCLDKIIISSTIFVTIFGQLHVMLTHPNEFIIKFWTKMYPRFYGIGQNPSVTAGILIVMLFYYHKSIGSIWRKILLFTIMAAGSGVGFLGLIYYFITRKWNTIKSKKLLFISASLIFISCYFMFYIYMGQKIITATYIYKLSPYYLFFLLKDKLEAFPHLFSILTSWKEILVGISWSGYHYNGGDFGWWQHLAAAGILGVLFNIYLLNNFIKNKKILFFILFSLFHYNTIWWPAGQIFLGFLIGNNLKNKDQTNVPIGFKE